jgi:hypothetical protein
MKKRFLTLVFALTTMLCCIFGFSACSKAKEGKLVFNTLSVSGENVYGKVSNNTTFFSFSNEIVVQGDASYRVYEESTCETEIVSKIITLDIGDNTAYVLQTVGGTEKVYTVTVRRRAIYEVSFNTNGGTSVQSQTVEEDGLAVAPIAPTKAGYTFSGWDFNFSTPITENTTVNAIWADNADVSYKVEYYLQNLENDEYSLQETVNKTGRAGTTVSAEIKTFIEPLTT